MHIIMYNTQKIMRSTNMLTQLEVELPPFLLLWNFSTSALPEFRLDLSSVGSVCVCRMLTINS